MDDSGRVKYTRGWEFESLRARTQKRRFSCSEANRRPNSQSRRSDTRHDACSPGMAQRAEVADSHLASLTPVGTLDRLVGAHRNWCWSARCPLNARPNSFCCFTWINGVDLRVRIHGRPRSDRKKRFLLSAVAPSTITRHPREARPINWAQRGGLASGAEGVS